MICIGVALQMLINNIYYLLTIDKYISLVYD